MTKSTGSGAGSTGPVEIMSEALSVADVLDRAADLIEPEGAWTQKANARDVEGHTVPASSGEASCFCIAGAILQITDGNYAPAAAVRAVLPEPDNSVLDWLVAFNDAPERTQSEVVAKLREAAAKAREQSA